MGRNTGNFTMTTTPSNFRILLIDDNPAIHEDFKKILTPTPHDRGLADFEAAVFGTSDTEQNSPLPYTLDSAFQGMEGLEFVRKAKAESSPYALAFVDVRMPPGWDGIETIRHIWKESPELQIVLCTAFSDYSLNQMQRIVEASDNFFILKKPFENIAVVQLAAALTRKWQRWSELNDHIARLTRELADAREEIAQLRGR